ncbi:MAG TPA: 1,4-alpha-glucan branching protein GlgB [Candidatus Hungatella pullicola]|nr:1,4-alpha-glucan branching protein GlgB [Candidatus Hungatella pullicola]
MDKKLYDLMDWAGIEEIVYSEAAEPERLLGPHLTEDGLLIQAFIPTAVKITVKLKNGGKEYPMELADEAGFFAVLIPRKTMADYTLEVVYDNNTTEETADPYSFASLYTESDLKKFEAGIHYGIYEKMGAHPMTIKGVEGVYFSVWAPCAMRVSVVGDFNLWDGRRHQMQRLGDSGIFQLFVPGLKQGMIYKYEIKHPDGQPQLKADPYANYAELRPNTASVIWDINQYQWKDQEWMAKRAKETTKTKPMSIYEVHLGSWRRKEVEKDDDGNDIIGSEFYNYREIAVKLAEYVKDMGYTHVEIMPVMEHPLDASWGYQVTGYYAPTSRYGTPDDFMYFMDYMHSQGIGVILDWVPAHFPRDSFGLACFDGTCVYEHRDPRQGAHPHWGTLIYNYGRPGVSNFLIANALFWADKYHADGIRMDAVASMLYLDYGKNDGEWVPNIYGGHENLEAVDFLKHLNSVFKGRKDGAVLIAEESTAWPQVTGNVKEGSLGFDYKWNMGWMNDFTGYMKCDTYFRKYHYGEMTFSMLYAYSEDFILVLSHDEVVHGKCSMIEKMPGDTQEKKAANLRTAYGFMAGHPGKKLLFMGQEFGQVREWNENTGLDWNLLQYPVHKGMQDYVRELNRLYTTYPALSQMDYDPDGFEWVECSNSEESIAVFLRKTKKKEETLLFVCNFDTILHEKFPVGVPFQGKYKEILNSDDKKFGGEGRINPRVKSSKAAEANERKNSIEITLAPLTVAVFTCTPGAVKDAKGKKKAETNKAENKNSPAEKTEDKTVTHKLEDKKPKTYKLEDKKPAAQKIEDKKPQTHKIEDKKPVAHKLEDKKPAAQKIEDKKPQTHKIEDKKPVAHKLEDKKTESEKIEDKASVKKKNETKEA